MKKKGTRNQETLPKLAFYKKGLFGSATHTITASANSTVAPTYFYSPELTPESWLLPKSRIEVLKWCRIFYNLEPMCQSIINMHAEYPFSTFSISTKDDRAREIFERLLFTRNINWLDFILKASLSYWKFGEAVVFGNWNKVDKCWDGFTCMDPDLIDIKQDPFTGYTAIELIPTFEIKKMVRDAMMSGKTSTVPEVIIENVINNKRIPLDAMGVPKDNQNGDEYEPPRAFVFARLTDPGAVRGSPILQSMFKTLIYSDKIRLAQIAIADRHHLPIELWTVGHLTGDMKTSFIPKEADLNNIRDMITQATQNPPFSIVYSPLLKYEAIGVSGKLLSVYEDLGYVENQLLVGFGVNKDLILGGSGCLDEKSNIVTDNGLKDINTISLKDRILTLNPKTGRLEYHKPNNIFKYEYNDKLIRFKTEELDLLVTPNHRCWVQQPKSNKWEFIEASEVKIGSFMKVGIAKSNKTGETGFKIKKERISSIENLDYKGRVWCVNVKHHIFMAERNGKFVLTGNSFSQSKTLSLHRLLMQYQVLRDRFSEWLKKNVLLPISIANNLVDEHGSYIVPNIKWDKSLKPEQDKEKFDMFYKMWKDGLVSTKTLFSNAPEAIDFEYELKNLESERDTVYDKKDKRIPKAAIQQGKTNEEQKNEIPESLKNMGKEEIPIENTEESNAGEFSETPSNLEDLIKNNEETPNIDLE